MNLPPLYLRRLAPIRELLRRRRLPSQTSLREKLVVRHLFRADGKLDSITADHITSSLSRLSGRRNQIPFIWAVPFVQNKTLGGYPVRRELLLEWLLAHFLVI